MKIENLTGRTIGSLSGGSAAGVLFILYQIFIPINDKLDALPEACEIQRMQWETLEEIYDVLADEAQGVADRYRNIRDHLATLDPPEQLSPVDRNRLEQKQAEADTLEARARSYESSARVVCQNPAIIPDP